MVVRVQLLPMVSPPTAQVRNPGKIGSRSRIPSCLATTDLIPGVLQIDPWLEPFKDALKRRYNKAKDWIKTIDQTEGGLNKFSQARYIIHRLSRYSCHV